ncbi:MAG: type II toxin-antitoxin system RelE/ParE family toxin [Candidatus Thioglobus sp.]|nr:type II toxin-antitoxin system RelE/ParE family toxin [Candidatus Thioglobus sp.]
MNIEQKPSFKRVYKKLHKNQRVIVNQAIKNIIKNPLLGKEKSGDLAGVFVYKFNCLNQQFLLAYQFRRNYRLLLLLGVNENFYKKLKIQ